MYRFKRSIRRKYDEQAYIYYMSRLYGKLSKERQDKILSACISSGEEYYQALFDFVVKGHNATEVCVNHYISKSTLYRIVRAYYEGFEIE